jgi:4-hydroxythreonine-4-phosphate dehydrogenase
MTNAAKPVVALTLGDPAGIGPELIAKLLSRPDVCEEANVVVVGDIWVWNAGQQTAGVAVQTHPVATLAEVRHRPHATRPAFLPVTSIDAGKVHCGRVAAECGASVLQVLNLCMDAAKAAQVDAICFAPLNKHAMKLGGLRHEDELHHFAEYLGVQDYFCEFNTLGRLWTSRVSSHIPLKYAARALSQERIVAAARLIHQSLRDSGFPDPRVAVAAFNPHAGDGGMCGREEIDIIAPAVKTLQDAGVPVEGPFPADTVFLKARDGHYQAVVTMYHDQGQIAIKLLGFSRGVTVQGGLPIPITTPAHGTAFDIAGRGVADVNATHNAFRIAARMGASQLRARQGAALAGE